VLDIKEEIIKDEHSTRSKEKIDTNKNNKNQYRLNYGFNHKDFSNSTFDNPSQTQSKLIEQNKIFSNNNSNKKISTLNNSNIINQSSNSINDIKKLSMTIDANTFNNIDIEKIERKSNILKRQISNYTNNVDIHNISEISNNVSNAKIEERENDVIVEKEQLKSLNQKKQSIIAIDEQLTYKVINDALSPLYNKKDDINNEKISKDESDN